MRKSVTLLIVAATFASAACTRSRGDEFAVAKSAPLIVPPDFALAPPVTGAAGPSAGDAQQQAVETLFGSGPPRPQIEMSMLEAAGSNLVKLGIRSTVWDPDTRITDKGATTLTLLRAQPANSDIATASAGQ